MSCWVIGGNNGLGDVLWLLNEAKHESDITFVGIPRTVELIEVVREFTTIDIRDVVVIDHPDAVINAPGIPEYRQWVQKWYSPHPGEKEYFFDYPHHGSFGSAPLRAERNPRGYIAAQLYSHRQPHHFWAPNVEALKECGHIVFTTTMTDDEPFVGTRLQLPLRETANMILDANLFVGMASGITGLAVFLGVPTIMGSATHEDMKSIPPHMDYLVRPSKESVLKRIAERM